jgi:hypothetical protein
MHVLAAVTAGNQSEKHSILRKLARDAQAFTSIACR